MVHQDSSQMYKTCLYRFIRRCQGCLRDYEPITPEHPYNNYSCPDYYEIHIGTFQVIDTVPTEDISDVINTQGGQKNG